MTREITIFFIRHAQGYHNINYRTLDDTRFKDASLTNLGIQQSINLQKNLNIKIDLVYSSPLSRCIQTMNYSIPNYNGKIMIDDRLIERLGDIASMRKPKNELHLLTDKKLNLENVDPFNIPYWTHGLEPDEYVFNRAKNWFGSLIEYIKINPEIKNIIVYSHSEILGLLFHYLFKKDGRFFNAECKKIIVAI